MKAANEEARHENVVPDIFHFSQSLMLHTGFKPYHPAHRRVVLRVAVHDLQARYGLSDDAMQYMLEVRRASRSRAHWLEQCSACWHAGACCRLPELASPSSCTAFRWLASGTTATRACSRCRATSTVRGRITSGRRCIGYSAWWSRPSVPSPTRNGMHSSSGRTP